MSPPQFSIDGTVLALDSTKGDVCFISHAHSDHLRGKARIKKVIASRETLHLGGITTEPSDLRGVKLHDAGHMLGAKQISIETGGRKIAYTGDIRLKEGIFQDKADVVECDELYVDVTYGEPSFRFPEPSEVYSQISSWLRQNQESIAVFGAYAIGKTQELVKLMNENGIVPVLHEKNFNFSLKYKELGINLSFLKAGTEEADEVLSGGGVVIAPPSMLQHHIKEGFSMVYSRRVLFASATGWCVKYRLPADVTFPLSDHSDFYDVIRYIEQSGAKEVHPMFGETSYLRNYLKLQMPDIKVV